MTVRCLICNSPGRWLCETKHDDDESDRALHARILEWERAARDGAPTGAREAEALVTALETLRALGFSPAALLSRSLLAQEALAGKSEEEALEALEHPGEADAIFAPGLLLALSNARYAAQLRNPVTAGGSDVDLEEEVPLLAVMGKVSSPARFLRAAADAIALGRRKPRARTALDFNGDAIALRVAKRIQRAFEEAQRTAPKSARTGGALAPFLRAAGIPAAYLGRLAEDLAVFRRRPRGGATLRELAALFLRDAQAGDCSSPRSAPSSSALRAAEAELDRLEKFPTTNGAVIGCDEGTPARTIAPVDTTARPRNMKRRNPDGGEAHEHGGPGRRPPREAGECPAHEVGRIGAEVHPAREARLVRPAGRPRVDRRAKADVDLRPGKGRVRKPP